jgi:hypothetical protein
MSRGKDKNIDKRGKGWERSLNEAERQILQYQRKIFELRNSIKIIQEKIASGEPWPRLLRHDHMKPDSREQHS